MSMLPFRIAVLASALVWCGPARAVPMHVMDSNPSAEATMDAAGADGGRTEFFVRFDGPVDHAASRLSVVQDGRVAQVLHPRLRSRPNTLYSGVRRLAPGAYVLRWETVSMQGRDASQGEIPFTVR